MLRNALKLISPPRLVCDYLEFCWAKVQRRGDVVRVLLGGLEIGGLSGFSEFHSCAAFINATERRFLRDFPFEDGPILDVGANLGIFSLLLAKRFPENHIHAFEPNPTTFSAMRTNFVRNRCPNAHAHPLAVAAHDGEVSFLANPIHRATTHIVIEHTGDGVAGTASAIVRVPCLTLDSFVETHGIERIGLLKVDVEGFEKLVFQGALRLLESGRAKMIYYEVCPELARRAGFAPEAASSQLLENGYRLHSLNKNGLLRPTALKQIAGVKLENWIAIHG
jgi:FkbM family methyltransferase